MYLSGEFQERDSVIGALRGLKENGLSPDDLDVFSDAPLELPRSALDRRTHMSLAVVTGAITSGLLAVGSVYFVQHDYEIVTGGMPIFSFWATGVVFFELTMLGAILTTSAWFIRESGLVRRVRRVPAPVFEPGMICLRIHCAADREQVLRQVMETAGAHKFTTVGDAK